MITYSDTPVEGACCSVEIVDTTLNTIKKELLNILTLRYNKFTKTNKNALRVFDFELWK